MYLLYLFILVLKVKHKDICIILIFLLLYFLRFDGCDRNELCGCWERLVIFTALRLSKICETYHDPNKQALNIDIDIKPLNIIVG